MTLKEIRELLVLKEWSREELAAMLGIVRNTIDKWFCVRESHRRYPTEDQEAKMKAWLAEARRESRSQPA